MKSCVTTFCELQGVDKSSAIGYMSQSLLLEKTKPSWVN